MATVWRATNGQLMKQNLEVEMKLVFMFLIMKVLFLESRNLEGKSVYLNSGTLKM